MPRMMCGAQTHISELNTWNLGTPQTGGQLVFFRRELEISGNILDDDDSNNDSSMGSKVRRSNDKVALFLG